MTVLNLKDILKGKVVILCIGNTERGDDGLGPHFAGMIKDKVPYEVIDAGIVPENWIGVVARLKPDTVIIVDAVYFDGKPGDIKIFSGENVRSGRISTHDVSQKLLTEYLKGFTRADIYILGIRPESNKYREGLSGSVQDSLENLRRYLFEAITMA